MKLKEIDWNAPGGAAEIDVEYPDQPIIDFVNWLRRTTAWRENSEIVERRVRQLNMVLMDHRAKPPAPSSTAVTSVQERRLAGLKKARETAAANRAARKAQETGTAA